MDRFHVETPEKTARIDLLKEELFRKLPEIEADRAVLLTESYMELLDDEDVSNQKGIYEYL